MECQPASEGEPGEELKWPMAFGIVPGGVEGFSTVRGSYCIRAGDSLQLRAPAATTTVPELVVAAHMTVTVVG